MQHCADRGKAVHAGSVYPTEAIQAATLALTVSRITGELQ